MKSRFYRFLYFRPADRGDYVMYLLLLVFLVVAVLCNIPMIISYVVLGENYHGAPILFSLLLLLIILFGTVLFRKGYTKMVDVFSLLFLLFIYTNIVLNSGSENEFSILLMVLYIFVAAMTLKGKAFFASFLTLFAVFIGLAIFEIEGIISPDVLERTNYGNVAGTAVILSMIVFVSWLFNKEINTYIEQLQDSKKLLQKERDLLETRVKERTKQLQEEQIEKMAELSRFAEFGRLAQGLFHDLMSPLTAISLNLGELRKGEKQRELNSYIGGATTAAKNMEQLINTTRDYFQHKSAKTSFLVADELKNLYQIFNFKAKKAGVNLIFEEDNKLYVYGNKTRFSQLIGNLVLNAIEAYDKSDSTKKEITIKTAIQDKKVLISVKDFAGGIPETVQKEIFKPFFTTKKHNGNSGIGLAMCRDIVETDFMGQIQLKSKPGDGTEFLIYLPRLKFK